MASRKYNIHKWRMILSEYEDSSQTVKDYCDSKNVSSKSFYYWKRKFSSVEKEESDTSFHELLFKDGLLKHEVPEQEAVRSAGIHIQIGKALLRLDRNFDIEEFRKTVEVLTVLSC